MPGEPHGQRSLEGTVYRVAKSWTQLKRFSILIHIWMVKRGLEFTPENLSILKFLRKKTSKTPMVIYPKNIIENIYTKVDTK